MSTYLLSWFVVVLAYYYIFLMPSFIISLALFYEESIVLGKMYVEIAQGALSEALLTTLLTTITLFALPGRYRRPLW
jgi:hypothetical protein